MQTTQHPTVLALLVAAMSVATPIAAQTGYIEGDYRVINTPQSGWIEQCDNHEGQHLQRGQTVIVLDSKDAQLAVQFAEQQLATASANRDNLLSGQRQTELQPLYSQRRELDAELALAKKNLARYQKLLKSQAVSAIKVDEMRANVNVLQAKIAGVDDNLKAKGLAARHELIVAADATVNAAKTAVAQAQQQLQDRQIVSRLDGEITRIYRYCGEFVTQGTPLLQLLPNNARKVIFFIPQAERDTWKVGQQLHVTADSGTTSTAEISHIGEYVEYTPPMIYSDSSRGDLVFRVEAYLDDDKPLPIGLPVEVSR